LSPWDDESFTELHSYNSELKQSFELDAFSQPPGP